MLIQLDKIQKRKINYRFWLYNIIVINEISLFSFLESIVKRLHFVLKKLFLDEISLEERHFSVYLSFYEACWYSANDRRNNNPATKIDKVILLQNLPHCFSKIKFFEIIRQFIVKLWSVFPDFRSNAIVLLPRFQYLIDYLIFSIVLDFWKKDSPNYLIISLSTTSSLCVCSLI